MSLDAAKIVDAFGKGPMQTNQTPDGFNYRSFYENLSERMTPEEVVSLKVLGNQFFDLIELLSSHLFQTRLSDSRMLDLSPEGYLWELQVFSNRFIRANCGSVLKIKAFCEQLLASLEDAPFREQFCQELLNAYEHYFFISEVDEAMLV